MFSVTDHFIPTVEANSLLSVVVLFIVFLFVSFWGTRGTLNSDSVLFTYSKYVVVVDYALSGGVRELCFISTPKSRI